MTVSLNGIVLDDDLQMPNIKNLPLRAGSTQMTLGGRPYRCSKPISSGRRLVLEAKYEDALYGEFTTAQVDAINALKATEETAPLVHHQGNWSVKVLETYFQMVEEVVNPDSTTQWYGQVIMLEV